MRPAERPGLWTRSTSARGVHESPLRRSAARVRWRALSARVAYDADSHAATLYPPPCPEACPLAIAHTGQGPEQGDVPSLAAVRPMQHASGSTAAGGADPVRTAPQIDSQSPPIDAERPSWTSRNRSHDGPQRGERIRLRLSSEELAALATAAHAAGLTVSGYAADALVAVVTGDATPSVEPLRSALADLLDARSQLRRLAANVHLAVESTHQNGQPPSWLEAAVRDAATAVRRVDEAAAAVTSALSRTSR